MKLKLLVATAAFAIFVGIIYLEQSQNPYSNPSAVTNNDISSYTEITAKKPIALPDFNINIIGNKNIKNIYDIKTDKLILHFWASWCTICSKEFSDIVKNTKANPNTTVIAISIDEDREALGAFLDGLEKQYQITQIPNLMFSWDHDKTLSQNIFGSELVPENYIAVYQNNHYEVTEKTIGKVAWNKLLQHQA